MLYRIILCSKTLCLNGQILYSVKVCTYCIHKDLCILKLRKCIGNILIDQTSCGDSPSNELLLYCFPQNLPYFHYHQLLYLLPRHLNYPKKNHLRRNCLCCDNSKFIRSLFLFGLCYCISIFRCLHECACCDRISCRICQCHSMCIRQKYHLRTDSVRKNHRIHSTVGRYNMAGSDNIL